MSIDSTTFWTGVGGVMGYTLGERIWPYHNNHGEAVSKVAVNTMRAAFTLLTSNEFKKQSTATPLSLQEVVLGVSAIALAYFSTQYLFPPPDIFPSERRG